MVKNNSFYSNASSKVRLSSSRAAMELRRPINLDKGRFRHRPLRSNRRSPRQCSLRRRRHRRRSNKLHRHHLHLTTKMTSPCTQRAVSTPSSRAAATNVKPVDDRLPLDRTPSETLEVDPKEDAHAEEPPDLEAL